METADKDIITHYLLVCADMLVAPCFVFILLELCHPNKLTKRTVFLHILPFVAVFIALFFSRSKFFFYTQTALTALYGIYWLIWGLIEIPRYNLRIKQNFSYEKNINLRWLYRILFSFLLIFCLWIASVLWMNINVDSIYLLLELILWIFVYHFIHRHKVTIDMVETDNSLENTEAYPSENISVKVHKLFSEEKIFLNPSLRLSDVYREIGTNRSYMSRYFNQECHSTFFDYVNSWRVRHAEKLLLESSASLEVISEQSGFNSLSTFRRAFAKIHDCSPTEFRKKQSML